MASLAKQGLITSPDTASRPPIERSRPASTRRRTASAIQGELDLAGDNSYLGQNRSALGYQIKCEACNFAKYPDGDLDAKIRAEKHARQKGLGHKVNIFHNGELQETVRKDHTPVNYDGPPPF